VITHEPDCAMVTTTHLTCTCGATTRARSTLRVVSSQEANERLAAIDQLLADRQPWEDLVGSVDQLRDDVDRQGEG
jgi:hypothetical protein